MAKKTKRPDVETNSKHMPGPLSVNRSGDVETQNGEVIAETCVVLGGELSPEIAEANASLLAAAYTSYDKHCGCRAIEFAEADLLGSALSACRAVSDYWASGDFSRDPAIWAKLTSVLAGLEVDHA